MKLISDEEYRHALNVFTEILNSPVDVYESGDIDTMKKFDEALELCLDYEQQCYGQKLNHNERAWY